MARLGLPSSVRTLVRSIVVLSALVNAGDPPDARAFPGVIAARDTAVHAVHTTHVVVLKEGDISVVTVMVDHRGPLVPFALILPVPNDVVAERVKTLKRGILSRLEALSAPRFHTFYEQDPCETGTVEQRWDERVVARGRGFLTLDGVPPLDERYAVSNVISAPIEPVFKTTENEFRYHALELREPAALQRWLREREYRISEASLAALGPHLGADTKLLVAEVSPDRVELVGSDRVQLGGIRYWSRRPLAAIAATLGLSHALGAQDLFVYVLDRRQRFQVANYPNRFLPTNVAVAPLAADQVGPVYNALFDRAAEREPQAFFTEYAWLTRGCGQPCPDAPLGLDELMSLGADVAEAHAAREPDAARAEAREHARRDRQQFESAIGPLPAEEQKRARRDYAKNQREITRRRALARRHTYVLTRLHHRYDGASLPRDVQLEPAPSAARGGVGVPKGSAGELPRSVEPASENEIQMRFVALKRFAGPVSCAEPLRHRWGKAWPSEARAARAVGLALNLHFLPRDPRRLDAALTQPLPGFAPARAPAPAASVHPIVPSKHSDRDGCAMTKHSSASRRGWQAALLAAATLLTIRTRRAARWSK